MSRPTRVTARKMKSYAEMDEGSDIEDEMSPSEGEEGDDDSFDEDPDKIEVPGGGTTLENSKKLATKLEQARASSSASLKVNAGGANSNSHLSHTPNILRGPKRPPMPGMIPISVPEGTTIRPSSVGVGGGGQSAPFDAAAFLSNPNFTNPLSSLLNFPFPGIKSEQGTMNHFPNNLTEMLGQLYGSLLANQSSASNILQQRPGQPFYAQGRIIPGQPFIQVKQEPKGPELEEIHEEDELGLAETYSDYAPAKLKYGKPHPDPIVETASLSSVQPPEVYYKLQLPSEVIDKGHLSALQLEAVVYACQQHEFYLENGQRAGYLIGDGAGVGKGRTIAGIIFENFLQGRKKALWVSVSADLKEDAIRDLRDIGARKIGVNALNKMKYGKIKTEDFKDGVLFSTYSGLIGESSVGKNTGKCNTRLKQIIEWLGGKDFDGMLVFDECHRAKNLCPVGNAKPTKTGITVQKLQDELPHARVVYASATGASEPKNMAYMTRLGIWGPGTPFNQFTDFINAVEKRGIGAMEVVAMDMKLRGAYIARQLSFKGVSFNIEEVPLAEDFQRMYDDSVALWVEAMNKFIEAAELMKTDNTFRKTMWAQFWGAHQRFFKYLCIAAKVTRAVEIASDALKDSKCVVIGLQSTGEARTAEQVEREGELDDFVSTAKGVFQSLVEKHLPAPNRLKTNRMLGISMLEELNAEPQAGSSSSGPGKTMRRAAQTAVKRAKFGYDSDSSSFAEDDSDYSAAEPESESEVTTDTNASESEDVDSPSEPESDNDVGKNKGKKRKAPSKNLSKSANTPRELPSKEALDEAFKIRQYLLDKVEQLGNRMPSNTLDQLIDDLGGPEDVAEMTGRKMRLIQVDSGKIEYQSRAESDVALDQINLTEKKRFMDGAKKVAIISEAASSGISLQSDRRVPNKLRRVHITLELPWSADRAIQQFGRTHRSNQVNAPEYVFLISDLAGEHRFASIVAKRLESLGALTHGDRRATETRDLSRFHIDNKYGKMAVETVMKFILTGDITTLPALPPTDFPEFREEVAAGLIGVGLLVNSEENGGGITYDKDYSNLSKFLNRILGMPVRLQNALFKFFTDTLTAIVANAKKQGRFDMGILTLGDSTADKTSIASTCKFTRKHATGEGAVILHEVVVERGMSWEEALKKQEGLSGDHDGFYLQKEARNEKQPAVLVIGDSFTSAASTTGSKKEKKIRFYSVYRPSTGLQLRRETLEDIKSKYTKVKPDEAKESWKSQHEYSFTHCTHAYWSGKCKNVTAGLACDIGKRRRTFYVLSGSVLLCWDDVENAMRKTRQSHQKIQIVRVESKDGLKLVGILIPVDVVSWLKEALSRAQEADSNMKHEEAE